MFDGLDLFHLSLPYAESIIMEKRKKEHIELAFQSQTPKESIDQRFDYEPLLVGHPTQGLNPISFLDHQLRAPIWISSMTGGTQSAFKINRNLAKACNEFGLGMGLGSCRALLKDNSFIRDFDLRDIIGEELPFYANLGICQVEDMVADGTISPIIELVKRLRTDGLIIHVNPLQEWFQAEGDRIKYSPIDTITRILDKVKFPIIVKEVGQGIGPRSMSALLKLPLAAVEFAAFGGTNFSKIETLREGTDTKVAFEPFSHIGMDADRMLVNVNEIVRNDSEIECRQIIISGGIKSFLDGYYLTQKSLLPAIYGQASSFLEYAQGNYDTLQSYVAKQIQGLEMAYAYLKIRD
jgi:isopentenyl-diphosphate delta-isomerase